MERKTKKSPAVNSCKQELAITSEFYPSVELLLKRLHLRIYWSNGWEQQKC